MVRVECSCWKESMVPSGETLVQPHPTLWGHSAVSKDKQRVSTGNRRGSTWSLDK